MIRDSLDHMLNIEDLDEVAELLDVFMYRKAQELFLGGVTDNETYKLSEAQIKEELWEFLKSDYFEDAE